MHYNYQSPCITQLINKGYYGAKILDQNKHSSIVSMRKDLPEHQQAKYGKYIIEFFSIGADGHIFAMPLRPWNF